MKTKTYEKLSKRWTKQNAKKIDKFIFEQILQIKKTKKLSRYDQYLAKEEAIKLVKKIGAKIDLSRLKSGDYIGRWKFVDYYLL